MSTPTPATALRRVVKVTRAQVNAARGLLLVDHRQGRATRPAVIRIAHADGDARWAPGGSELARIAALPRLGERARWWHRLTRRP